MCRHSVLAQLHHKVLHYISLGPARPVEIQLLRTDQLAYAIYICSITAFIKKNATI